MNLIVLVLNGSMLRRNVPNLDGSEIDSGFNLKEKRKDYFCWICSTSCFTTFFFLMVHSIVISVTSRIPTDYGNEYMYM